ncbi:SusC/RagA family TonB-linked outer membrane protein [Arachidicoccus terrestris]|uniref:SusC/RagA family TonB-linked outer membrane protein n=1 Tax=Arachidicoccus terrestris TaxID=2875539 RepID=UPI001CC3614A|nr:TonB-dependent receptor [Arachidicoccus terrestris]UAY53792.1 TonB-dependent receptor [Arachidicoccus terrestris]
MKKKILLLQGLFVLAMTLFFLSPAKLLAQEVQTIDVKGTVVDESGQPLSGATIQLKGKQVFKIADSNGAFDIQAPSAATLIVTSIGYVKQEVAVTGPTIKVVMHPEAVNADSVVVIGYGSVKRTDLTGAVASMDAKDIKDRPLARAETALQGKLAGVTVRTTTGEPGADMQIRVRGAASVNASSDPLYVVDGVPIQTLAGLNPDDIASIEVLKDAASAAIYGSRGSNGVVLVTTKRGKSGKPRIAYSQTYGVQSLEKKMDILSAREWMEFKMKTNDAMYLRDAATKGITDASIKDDNATRLANLGIAEGSTTSYQYVLDDRWFNYLSDALRSTHSYDPNAGSLALLDWQDEFFRHAPVQDYNVNVSGGSDNTKYMFSGGYMKQDGIATGTDYDRFTFRMNVESRINKVLTAGMTLAPTFIRRDGSGRANGKDAEVHHVLTSTPVSEPEVGYMTNVEPNEKYPWAGSTSSPSYVLGTNIRHDEYLRIMGSAFLRATPLDGLKIELSASTNYYDLEGSTYSFTSTSSKWAQGVGSQSSGAHNTARTWSTLLQALANYDHSFGKSSISAMLGVSSERSNAGFSTNQSFNKPFPNDEIPYSFDGGTLTVGTSRVLQATPDKLNSAFGRVSYNYDSRYLLSASLRYDGGSVFGQDNKWGAFPAASAGWVISNENFFKNWNQSWWNNFKLRGSFGVTGNNSISSTAAYASLAALNYGGAVGYSANSLGNPDLGWEKTNSTDLAADLGFLNNRLQLSLDWYTKTTKDLLYQVPTLAASGFTTTFENLGSIRNHGFEIELKSANTTGELKWNTALNVAFNKNKVLSLGLDNTPVYSGFGSGNPSNILEVGRPINTFYMYDAIGVWMNQKEIDDYSAAHGGTPVTFEGKTIHPGDIRYKDVNNDGAFTKEDDRDYLGGPVPTVVYGMTNNFTYKNFDLSILLTAQTGGKIFGVLGRAFDRPSMGASSNVIGKWRNAWWSEEDPGDGKTPYILSSTTGTTLDSRWLYSSNYLRVKNVTLGYTIPFRTKAISNARVFLSVENLLRWDSYEEDYSPEAANTAPSSSPGGQSAVGLDYGGYPIPRIVTMGINITF